MLGSTVLREPVALLEGLSFTYAGAAKPALFDFNLKVKSGEFVAITGPSGCGKSTLSLCLTGFIPHAFDGEMEGLVRVGGLDTRQVIPGKLAGISGLVQQDPEAQLCTLKVIDEVAFGPENLRLPPEKIKKRVKWSLEAVDSSDLMYRDVHSLSGGEKQRVAIASVLAMAPGLLILDEPTANLDPRCTMEVLAAIENLRREKNTAIIVIEHRLQEILPLADRLIVMEEGRIVADGDPWETKTWYQKELFGKNKKPLAKHNAASVTETNYFFPENNFPEKSKNSRKPLLAVENLTSGYTADPVINDINFKIYPGEFLALMGDNGSGKTSLLHTLLGILKPQKGHIYFQEQNITDWSVARRAQLMGLTFQNPNHQLFEKTVRREAQLPSSFLARKKAESHNKVENLLKYFGLWPYKDRIPQALSMGEKKRLTLVSVLAYQPPLLLLDEPLVGQDVKNLALLREILHKYRKKGGVVLMVCHEPAVVRSFNARVLFLEKGRLVIDAPVEKAFALLKERDYGKYYVGAETM
ncbi:MAG: ATP-binding cassette domain-containing protein [Firmicutes bacterium]|nr:ATP-binding cassette domain-containing protein [Bacillota bacterium]